MTGQTTHRKHFVIPKEVSHVTETLEKAGFEAFLVGGCVRDLVVGKKPKDWDITTNARPEEIQGLFEETFYENDFGTVGVVTETEDSTLKVVEITHTAWKGSTATNAVRTRSPLRISSRTISNAVISL